MLLILTLFLMKKIEDISVYPKFIGKHYHAFKKGLVESKWVKIPTEIGFCFTLTNDARPLFLNVIPATIQYDSAVDTERERDLEEIRKIIVKKKFLIK